MKADKNNSFSRRKLYVCNAYMGGVSLVELHSFTTISPHGTCWITSTATAKTPLFSTRRELIECLCNAT